jgi:hypothetical protein
MLSYVEFVIPMHNYTGHISWMNHTHLFCQLFDNEQSMVNGSGSFHHDALNRLTVNLTDIHPKHMGYVHIKIDNHLTSDSHEYLDKPWRNNRIDWFNWRHVRIETHIEQAFFFWNEHVLIDLSYNVVQTSFDILLKSNTRSTVQCTFVHDQYHHYQALHIETNLINFDYRTQVSQMC